MFHYGDCDEKSAPALEDLTDKLPVVDIKALAIGKECPHVKDVRYEEEFNFGLIVHQLVFFNITLCCV